MLLLTSQNVLLLLLHNKAITYCTLALNKAIMHRNVDPNHSWAPMVKKISIGSIPIID